MRQDPRRQAAQSLREMRDEKVLLPAITLIGFALGSLSTAAGAWLVSRLTDHWPWYTTGAAAALCIAAAWMYFALPAKARPYNRGIRGEQTVADALGQLAAHGYHIFHDLPDTTRDGRPCNIDHVVAGPEGVFTIETKFRSKAPGAGQKSRLKVTPEALLVGGRPVQPDPRDQARACADSVRRRLTARLGAEAPVRPVVIMPSWYTEGGFGDGCWVLNESALVRALATPRQQRLAGPSLRQVVAELDAWSRQREP